MIGEGLQQSASVNSLETLLDLQRREASDRNEKSRANKRFGVQCSISLEAGNSSDRNGGKLKAVCSDLSVGGCRVIAPRPQGVGDIYWLSFEATLNLPPVFARCVRCRMIREDAFETGFQFFSDIVLTTEGTSEEEDLVDMI